MYYIFFVNCFGKSTSQENSKPSRMWMKRKRMLGSQQVEHSNLCLPLCEINVTVYTYVPMYLIIDNFRVGSRWLDNIPPGPPVSSIFVVRKILLDLYYLMTIEKRFIRHRSRTNWMPIILVCVRFVNIEAEISLSSILTQTLL